ncbi:MAG: anaerobic ribonucleoside-triphosphate reductase activating protein [Deltaproteobacteria bacterium]|nr:anaerobic ribonucleoside-triphosphate reductase activating protein [Deltaproteobacteria bacterium]
MVLGGLQKSSLIDYPGKVSSVAFFSGCNFDCPYCHNPDLARGELTSRALDDRALIQFLSRRVGLIDGVVMSGGEPTLQNGLSRFCRKVKDMGFRVKEDTNGSRPAVLEQLLKDDVMDYVAMDIKTDPDNYGRLAKGASVSADIKSSIRIVMAAGIDYEFRTTCVKPFVDESIIRTIAHLIQGARLYALQRFREETLLHPDFFKEKPRRFDESELSRFQSIAGSQVETCVVR